MSFFDSEPMNFDEAMRDKRWRQAMKEEINAIKKNNTWELSTLPKGHEAIGVKRCTRQRRMFKEIWRDTRQGLWLKVTSKSMELIMNRFFHLLLS